jgi:hypothetical protein
MCLACAVAEGKTAAEKEDQFSYSANKEYKSTSY